MVSVLTPELTQKLPRTLEGYSVKIEETGNFEARGRADLL